MHIGLQTTSKVSTAFFHNQKKKKIDRLFPVFLQPIQRLPNLSKYFNAFPFVRRGGKVGWGFMKGVTTHCLHQNKSLLKLTLNNGKGDKFVSKELNHNYLKKKVVVLTHNLCEHFNPRPGCVHYRQQFLAQNLPRFINCTYRKVPNT